MDEEEKKDEDAVKETVNNDEVKTKEKTEKGSKKSNNDKPKKSKTTKIIIILLIIIAIIVAFGIGGYFAKKHSDEDNKTVGTEWGDTYYSFLKSVKDADDNKLKEVGLTKDVKKADINFIELKTVNNPEMVLTYQKDNQEYTNVYFINDDQNVSTIAYSKPTTLKFMYNREQQVYAWYLYTKEDDNNMYKPLLKAIDEIKMGKAKADDLYEVSSQNATQNAAQNTAQNQYQGATVMRDGAPTDPAASAQGMDADYVFKDSEMTSNLDVADGEIPTISKFDQTFIEIDVPENKQEINFDGELSDLKQSITTSVSEYKTNDQVVTDEVKTETQAKETELTEKSEEIDQLQRNKQAEEEKRQAEENAKKQAEEQAKQQKAAEQAKTDQSQTNTTSSAGRITEAQAKKLAEKIDGTKSSETGFEIGYNKEAMVKDENGLEYYLFRVAWLVDNSHWSTIDGVAISVDGKKWRHVDIFENYKDGETIRDNLRGGNF